MDTFISHFQKAEITEKTDDYVTFLMPIIDGCGTATVYPLFTGIEMVILNINANRYLPGAYKKQNVLEINYCVSGRSECKMDDGCLQYIGKGDIFLTTLYNYGNSIELPLNYYSGIVLYIDLDTINIDSCKKLLVDTLNVKEMLKNLLKRDQCFLLQARESTNNFFSDVYSINEKRLSAYYRLKTLELLLYLENINPEEEKQAKAYTSSQVERVKQIEKYMTENLSKRLTIDELSQKYCISSTALKSLFKDVYGKPISTYMKEYRIQKAKNELIETDLSIAEIASMVGYESQSKFGAVFRNMTGLTPLEFRKNKQ